ncbi:hypothetical protein GF386_04640 [Candidatus Pacearchaeota archaeon]|nr:hypothetical protein [Candidatus Pacearchaeota archaeon]MBD3283404.1 hypothetical protein [Candidatus Pacearchaeota archaeon]
MMFDENSQVYYVARIREGTELDGNVDALVNELESLCPGSYQPRLWTKPCDILGKTREKFYRTAFSGNVVPDSLADRIESVEIIERGKL